MAFGAVAQRASAAKASGNGFTQAITAGTPGNFLVAVLALSSTGTSLLTTNPTDDGTGSAWQQDVGISSSSGSHTGLAVWSTPIGSAAPANITFAWSGAANTSAVKIFEFSGSVATSWGDPANPVTAAEAAGTAASTGTITPQASGELIIAAFATNSAQSSFTAGAGYTSWGAPTNTGPDVCCEYKLSGGASESNGGTFGASVTTASRGAIVAYLPALLHTSGRVVMSREAQRRSYYW